MKRAAALALALVIALSLTACGLRRSETVQDEDTVQANVVTGDENSTGEENTGTVTVGGAAGSGQNEIIDHSGAANQNVVITPTVAVTPFPVPSNTPAPTPTVAPTPGVSPTPNAAATPTPDPDVTIVPLATATQAELNSAKAGYVNGNGVNMRAGVGTKTQILNTYNAGTNLLILGTQNGWTKVSVNGVVGYIWSEFVSTGNPSPYVESDGNAVIVGSDPTGDGGTVNSDGSTNAFIVGG